jgi:hypothetical protein
MIDHILRSHGLTLDYLGRLVADLDDSQIVLQPAGAVNHPAWVLGHLIYSCQLIGGEVGLPPWLTAHWADCFGSASAPSADPSVYPPKADLLHALDDARARLAARLTAMGEAELAAPLPDVRYRATFPTIGHAVLHILVAHASMHVGQVAVWRRVAGLPPVPEPFA